MIQWTIAISIALLGGFLGYASGFPVGTLLGSLLFVLIYQLYQEKKLNIPDPIKKVVQVVIGASIGLSFTQETVLILKEIWYLTLLVPILQIIFSLLLAKLLVKITGIDIVTALCSSAPGGMSELSTLLDKYNVSILTVVTIHFFRIVIIVTLLPLTVVWFLS
jgi:membrane AbrB-like protein